MFTVYRGYDEVWRSRHNPAGFLLVNCAAMSLPHDNLLAVSQTALDLDHAIGTQAY